METFSTIIDKVHAPAESRCLLEYNRFVLYLYLRVADLADSVHDPAERPGKPPGVECFSRMIEVIDTPATWNLSVKIFPTRYVPQPDTIPD
jgi:hypothetical protein